MQTEMELYGYMPKISHTKSWVQTTDSFLESLERIMPDYQLDFGLLASRTVK